MKRRIAMGVVGATLGAIIGVGGPDEVEAMFWPVASDTKGQIVSDNGREVCWVIEFKKLREASPLFFAWVATTPLGERFYLAPYRRDGQSYTDNNTTRKDEIGKFASCAIKPRNLGKDYTLEAFARYKVHNSNLLWSVPRRIGPFK